MIAANLSRSGNLRANDSPTSPDVSNGLPAGKAATDPALTTGNSDWLPEIRQQAQGAMQTGNWAIAEAMLDRQSHSKEFTSQDWVMLANARAQLGKYDATVEAFGNAVKLAEDAKRFDLASSCESFLGGYLMRFPPKISEGRSVIRHAIGRDPSNPEPHFVYAGALMQYGNYVLALRELSAARILNPLPYARNTIELTARNCEVMLHAQKVATSFPMVVVVYVLKGSQADAAGIGVGDTITRIDGTNIGGIADVYSRLSPILPAQQTTLTMLRDAQTVTARVHGGVLGAILMEVSPPIDLGPEPN
jgi:tetratricopeptide (TPR) repeat protein